jgi:hypothetical protein
MKVAMAEKVSMTTDSESGRSKKFSPKDPWRPIVNGLKSIVVAGHCGGTHGFISEVEVIWCTCPGVNSVQNNPGTRA